MIIFRYKSVFTILLFCYGIKGSSSYNVIKNNIKIDEKYFNTPKEVIENFTLIHKTLKELCG